MRGIIYNLVTISLNRLAHTLRHCWAVSHSATITGSSFHYGMIDGARDMTEKISLVTRSYSLSYFL